MDNGAIFGHISGWIYAGLAFYLVIVVAIGLYFSRDIKECKELKRNILPGAGHII